jgi:hypothetical protein
MSVYKSVYEKQRERKKEKERENKKRGKNLEGIKKKGALENIITVEAALSLSGHNRKICPSF